MSKSQIRKLETILAKLEALQHQVQDDILRATLGAGKRELIAAWRAATREDT